MGNQHSHDGLRKNSLSRTPTEGDNNDSSPTQMIPIDQLAKVEWFSHTCGDILHHGIIRVRFLTDAVLLYRYVKVGAV
jgi:hypothetical protein